MYLKYVIYEINFVWNYIFYHQLYKEKMEKLIINTFFKMKSIIMNTYLDKLFVKFQNQHFFLLYNYY